MNKPQDLLVSTVWNVEWMDWIGKTTFQEAVNYSAYVICKVEYRSG